MASQTTSSPGPELVRRPRVRRAPADSQSRRAVASGTAGSILEWFDFAVYGAMSATVFPVVFFSEMTGPVALLASFATFGVGIFARPLGGIVFGHLGDRIGRRAVLLATFLLMGVSSAIIGLLPPYAQIGLLAPLLLVVMRFVQGVALGGEATGAQLMTMEHAPRDRRGFYSALMSLGSPASQVIANLLLALLTATLSDADFFAWGWRLPFLLSLALVGVGIYIRLKVEETPIFREGVQEIDQKTSNPATVVRDHWRTMIRLIMCYSPIVVTFYVVSVYGISYMTSHGLSRSESFTIVMISNLLSVVAIVIGGRVADTWGRRNTLMAGGAGCLVASLVFFPVVDLQSFPLTLAVVAFALVSAQFGNAGFGALFAEAFPTRVRYTGSALALTGANLIFAAPAPFLASWLTTISGGSNLPITVIWLGIIVAALVVLSRTSEGPTLEGEPQYFGRYVPVEFARAMLAAQEHEVAPAAGSTTTEGGRR
ncbi:MFS transporter [Promicromonospora vindobonensis]|uniref:MFS transporter n=1 Tax=Promicromonospora vindobonensis TaxID=195748 RepID=A0ABW5VWY2_9MICO